MEAFIAGWGLDEALHRANAYHEAGADAVLMHSKLSEPDEIISFMQEWDDRGPVVVVPTKYYNTPTWMFQEFHISLVIWANHLMRASIKAMQETAEEIFTSQAIASVEQKIAPLEDVFRLQNVAELQQAEKSYLHGSNDQRERVPTIHTPL